MPLPLIQIDAFTNQPFAGNPAAVCLLPDERPADWMQSVAAEMNLSETAFLWPLDHGYRLRWFTPTVEVDLCGHATIASAHAMWSEQVVPVGDAIEFQTNSGTLIAAQSGDWIELDFPATPPTPTFPDDELLAALGIDPSFVGKTEFDSFVVLESEQSLLQLTPDFRRLSNIATRGVIVTSRTASPGFDFVSRFFAPAAGIDEDPVTGSAHCALAPYWAQISGKTSMVGYQASSRGGIVRVVHRGDRVTIAGQAITVMRGELEC